MALLQPSVPGNCGTIARSCIAFPAALHLIQPLFDISRAKRSSVGHLKTAPIVNGADLALSDQAGEELAAIANTRVVRYEHADDFLQRGLPSMNGMYAFSKLGRHGSTAINSWRPFDHMQRFQSTQVAALAGGNNTHPDATLPSDIFNLCLLFGNESFGLERHWDKLEQHVTDSVYIEMAPEARSLNLGVAASIAMHEVTRQAKERGLQLLQ